MAKNRDYKELLPGVLLGTLFVIPGYMYHLQIVHELKMQVFDDIQSERRRISKPYSQLIDKLLDEPSNNCSEIVFSEMAKWKSSGISISDKYLK